MSSQLASRSQLRWSLARVALITVPLVLLLGSLSGRASGSSEDNPWFEGLVKPEWQPPGWAFPVAWTTLYVLMGLAVAMVIAARGARGRWLALGLFVVQLALNLAWSPLFFRMHRIMDAFWLLIAILVVAIVTTVAFGRVRRVAAWLMLPYLVWLSFAAVLNWRVGELNPKGSRFVPDPGVEVALGQE
jgi:tryptophan-rich sensory protein